MLALSQSGRTPDVVSYVELARAAGAFTVAVTNDPESDLGRAAEAILPLAAGPERSIAATKTYLNTVAALALLAAHAAGRGHEFADGIAKAADQIEEVLPGLESSVAELAVSFAFVGRMFVIGRGTELATAREVALKLLETCRVAAEPMTATAFAHGPVAALDALFPVWAIASKNQNVSVVREAVARAPRQAPPSSRQGTSQARWTRRTTSRRPSRRTRSSRRSSRCCRGSCSRARSRSRRATTRTTRAPREGHAGPLSGLVSTIPALWLLFNPACTGKKVEVVLTGMTRSCHAPRVAHWYEPIGERPDSSGHLESLAVVAGGRE